MPDAASAVLLCAALLFALRYSMEPWRDHRFGISLMLGSAGGATVALGSALRSEEVGTVGRMLLASMFVLWVVVLDDAD